MAWPRALPCGLGLMDIPVFWSVFWGIIAAYIAVDLTQSLIRSVIIWALLIGRKPPNG